MNIAQLIIDEKYNNLRSDFYRLYMNNNWKANKQEFQQILNALKNIKGWQNEDRFVRLAECCKVAIERCY